MRIIAGKYKGIKLNTPPKGRLRPALQKVREAVFNIFDVSNATFLDAFAGTGSIGFEALSRGVRYIDFVEKDRLHASILNDNIKMLKLDSSTANVFNLAFENFVKVMNKNIEMSKRYEYIFLGPPYALWQENWILKALCDSNLYNINSTIICEHTKRDIFPLYIKNEENNNTLVKCDERKYGETILSVYKMK